MHTTTEAYLQLLDYGQCYYSTLIEQWIEIYVGKAQVKGSSLKKQALCNLLPTTAASHLPIAAVDTAYFIHSFLLRKAWKIVKALGDLEGDDLAFLP